MILNLDSLNDPLTTDGSASFAGGQVSNVRANLLKPDEAAELINYDITRTGELRTRRGTTRLGTDTAGSGSSIGANDYVQGLVHFWTTAFDYTIAATGGKLYQWTGSAWTNITSYGAVDNRVRIHLAQGINNIFIADGANDLRSWDGTTLFALGGTTNANPPPAPYWITWFTNRLIAVGPGVPDGLYFSQFLDGGLYDRTKWQLRVGGGEGDPVLGFIGWTDFNLVVFKRSSIWTVGCDPLAQINNVNNDISGFPIKQITRRFGGWPATAAQVGNDILFLASDRTVRSVGRTLAAENQSQASDSLSAPVQDILDRINLNAIRTACGTGWKNKYVLSIPIDGADSPNAIVIYDRLLEAWVGTWTGLTPTAFAARNVGGNSRLAIGQSNGTVHEYQDYVAESAEITSTFQDNGVDIPTTHLSRAFIFNEPFSTKQGFNCEFEFNKSLADVTIEVIRDAGDPETFQSFATATEEVTLPVILPFVLPTVGVKRRAFVTQGFQPFRELQFRIKTTAGKVVLRSILTTAFVNSMNIEL